MQFYSEARSMRKSVEAMLLNACSINSVNLNDGKLGLSLCLFEVARYLNDESAEDVAFNSLQEILVLRQKGKPVKPLEVGFVLLYLIENQLIDADFDELFEEDARRLLNSIQVFRPYSASHLIFIPFLSLLWSLKKEDVIRQLIVEILDGAALSLVCQFDKMQTVFSTRGIPEWEEAFSSYLKASFLFTDYTISLQVLEQYATLYRQGRISNRFVIGFYMENLLHEDSELYSFGKMIQEYGIQNIYPDILSLSQRIDLLYLLKQKASLYDVQIQQLEGDLFNFDNPMYEKELVRLVPLNKSPISYESGLARLLLYRVYAENLQIQQDCTRFRYLFT